MCEHVAAHLGKSRPDDVRRLAIRVVGDDAQPPGFLSALRRVALRLQQFLQQLRSRFADNLQTLHGDSVGQDNAKQRSAEAIWPRKPTRQSIAQEKALSSLRTARLISGLLRLALLLLAEGIERLGQSVG
jgi:hypothetical protein